MNRETKIIRHLLQEKSYDVIVTEDVIKIAALNGECGNEIIELLLDLRGDEVKISEEVVKNAVRNITRGEELIKLLLDRRRDEVKVTEEVMRAATQFGIIWKAGTMWLLLDRLEDADSIPDEVLKVIPKKWDSKEKIMRDITYVRRENQKRLRIKELQKKGLPDDYDPEAQYDL